MQFHLKAPHPLLSQYVKVIWCMDCETDLEIPYLYQSMADGMTEVVFQYRGGFSIHNNDTINKLPSSFMLGQSDTFTTKSADSAFGAIGVYLYPYALPVLFGLPADELSNEQVELSAILKKDVAELEESIASANCFDERVVLINDYLLCKLVSQTHSDVITSSVAKVIRENGKVDVVKMAAEMNVSRRQFERRFKPYAGFSPKHYSRIIRFQSALNECNKGQLSLTDISYLCGYSDQSHFIHEFKEFSGYHPKAYYDGKATGTELRASL